MSYALSSPADSTCTDGTLRKLFHAISSSSVNTMRTRPSTPEADSAFNASLVLGCEKSHESTTNTRSLLARSDSADASARRTIFLGVRCA